MTKRNTTNLADLESAVKSGKKISLTAEQKIPAKKIMIIKRDGRKEPYNVEKMRRVIQYATENEVFTDELLRDTEIKLYDEIKIVDLFDELIKTAVTKISMLYPQWEYIAAKLYLMKIYKDVWHISDGKTLPHLSEVLKKGVQHKVYDKTIVDSYTEEEIDKLNNAICQERDLIFTYKSLFMFFDKYCLSYSKKKKLELPQFAYMRVAMFLHWKDDKEERIQNIIKTYDHISQHDHTFATPIMLRSFTEKPQTASCVLTAMADDSDSILDTYHALGVYSKYNGGTATDVSRLRASGSYINGNQGLSSGPVPFIKTIESVMKAWNQGCYSDDTEILTERGWKLFSELNGEKVAQYNKEDGSVEFVHYTDYIEYHTNEPLINFKNKSGHIDLLVTKNHRMVKRIGNTENIVIGEAEDFEYASDNYAIVSGLKTAGRDDITYLERFLIAYQADGTFLERINGKQNGNLAYQFRFKKERKIERLENILINLNFDYTKRKDKTGAVTFYVKVSIDEHEKFSKTFDWVNVADYSYKGAEQFIEELKYWDGSKTKESNKTFTYSSIDKVNVDVIQALCVLSGYRTKYTKKIRENRQDLHYLSITFNQYVSSSPVNKKDKGIKKHEVEYNGKVYCVTVPSSLVVVRRNGAVAISGNSTRPGANCVYFQWWHIDYEKMIVLKSNGGTDENRARGLKYAVKLNHLYWKRVLNDEEITLFDPKDVPDLFEVWGDEFERRYVEYENKSSIRKKRMSAREHCFKLMKERTETGNIYIFDEENVNNQNMVGRYINSSNLCCEILQKSVPSRKTSERLIIDEDGKRIIQKEYTAGEISLCNLSSINLVKWYEKSEREQEQHIYNLVKAMDNTIDIGFYPVKEGANSNKQYRYLGIGVNNFTNLLALNGIVIDTQEALEFTDNIFSKLSYQILKASCKLAQERGSFPRFHETKWAKGYLPIDFANEYAKKLANNSAVTEDEWRELSSKIMKYGLRNALLMAIAPTATSGKAINATESIEPIIDLFYKEEGTTNIPTLVPNFRKNNRYYKKAFDCDQYKLIELAAVRQKYMDQGQSVNLYFRKPDSFLEQVKIHAYASKLGVKTLYYLKQRKKDDEPVCESCT